MTLKQLVQEPAPPSALVAVILRVPVVAVEAMVRLAVSWVALTKVVELTVTPLPDTVTTAPLTKLVPVTVTFCAVAP